MFTYYGAFIAWLSFMLAGGRPQLYQIYFVHYERRTSIFNNPAVEVYGRLLAFVLQSLAAMLNGGFGFAILRSKASSTGPPTQHVWQILSWMLDAIVFSGIIFAGKMPHTTWFTKLCVKVVVRLLVGAKEETQTRRTAIRPSEHQVV